MRGRTSGTDDRQAADTATPDYAQLAAFRHELRRFLHFSEAEAKRAGIQPRQYHLLLALKAAEPRRPHIQALADELVVLHHTAVELVDRLEAKRLVRRRRDRRDPRRVLVELTPAGERVVTALAAKHLDEIRASRALASALETLARGSARPSRDDPKP